MREVKSVIRIKSYERGSIYSRHQISRQEWRFDAIEEQRFRSTNSFSSGQENPSVEKLLNRKRKRRRKNNSTTLPSGSKSAKQHLDKNISVIPAAIYRPQVPVVSQSENSSCLERTSPVSQSYSHLTVEREPVGTAQIHWI